MKILIIGGVAGGATAAARLRRLSEENEIIIFEKGEHVSFANCGLPYHIGGVIEEHCEVQSLAAEGDRITHVETACGMILPDDYLRAVALVLMDWAWLRIEAGLDDSLPQVHPRWRAPAKALRDWVLPEFQMRSFIIVSQCTMAAS